MAVKAYKDEITVTDENERTAKVSREDAIALTRWYELDNRREIIFYRWMLFISLTLTTYNLVARYLF